MDSTRSSKEGFRDNLIMEKALAISESFLAFGKGGSVNNKRLV